MAHAGGFALVSGTPAGVPAPIRCAAIPGRGGILEFFAQNLGTASDEFTGYELAEGSLGPPCVIEWTAPAPQSLLLAATYTPDAERNGEVWLFAPMAGEHAASPGASFWTAVGTPNASAERPGADASDDRWLTETAPAMVPGTFGPHGSLELCLAVRDGGFRHLFVDALNPGNLGAGSDGTRTWNTSGVFADTYQFSGLALVQDAFSNHIVVLATTADEVIVLVRGSDLEWGAPRSVWSPPAGTTLSGVPALWQEQLPPQLSPHGVSEPPGDLLAAVGLSDGSVQLLRLSYATVGTADASSAAPPLPALPPEDTVGSAAAQAVAIAQAPPARPLSIWGEFTERPIEVYTFRGFENHTTYSTVGGGAWSAPNLIYGGEAAVLPH